MPSTTPTYTWLPHLYNKNAAFAYSEENTKPVFELLSPQYGDRIVDVGCGTGELSVRLQGIVGKGGLVLGIDSSESMVSVLYLYIIHI
jgi:ubiquinone/menaquinone biosynthesis C-methylase UbiE